jgi:hypothetical protein
VAEGVARELKAELDVAVARKLGAPGCPELAIGAVAADGTTWLDDDLIARLAVSAEYLRQVAGAEHAEAKRRERLFRGDRPGPRVAGRTVIVVDDGLATGATMFAAVATIRNERPHYVVVAAPVCTREAAEELREVAGNLSHLPALPRRERELALDRLVLDADRPRNLRWRDALAANRLSRLGAGDRRDRERQRHDRDPCRHPSAVRSGDHRGTLLERASERA